MSSQKFFSVIVGGKPMIAQAGFLGDDGKPKTDSVQVVLERAGTAVPNYSRVWGVRELDSKKEPNGNIKFLEWGDPAGYIVEIRYLKTILSLDMEYQKKKGMRVTDADAEIHLLVGVNNFDPVKEKMLIEMLKLHYQNGENKSRDPSVPVAFNTYDAEKITKRKVTDIQLRQDVENIVINANLESSEALEILASLFPGIDPRQQHDELFNILMEMTVNFKSFESVLEYHRGEYQELLQKAKELELIDVSPKEAIYITLDGNRDILVDEMENGGTDKVVYILKNFYKPKYFNALQTLKNAYKKFEHLVLN